MARPQGEGAAALTRGALTGIYAHLFEDYGPQGWWPLLCAGYHKGDYSYPRNGAQRFEIGVGAILTQNTAWKNVEKALGNLKEKGLLGQKRMASAPLASLREAIRPAGYFNQKAKKLRTFARFCAGLRGRAPARKELLAVWGIGPETADSILLYAYRKPEFVVDAYTRRIMRNLGLISDDAGYDEVKQAFESALEPRVELFQEYHALLVEHAKRHYSGKADPRQCPLLRELS